MQKKVYTEEFKQRVIKEAIETGSSSVVARRYEVAPSIVARWVRKFKSGNIPTPKMSYNHDEYKRLMAENEKLKRLLGEKDLEIDILSELIKKGSQRWKKE